MADTKQIVEMLKKLSLLEVRAALKQAGLGSILVERRRTALGKPKKRGLTPGLHCGLITYIAEDFNAELPDSFWLGGEE